MPGETPSPDQNEMGLKPEDIAASENQINEESSGTESHLKHEVGTPQETKFSKTYELINQGLNNPNFSAEFRPEENWQGKIKILSDSEFDETVITFNKDNIHPIGLEEMGKDIDRKLKEYSMVMDARVDSKTGEILIRESYLNHAVPDSVLFVLCHELGHSIPEDIHEEYDGFSDPQVPNLVKGLRSAGYKIEARDLTVQRRGLLEQLMLEGKQIRQISNNPEIYGDFFDEMYADVYRLYLMANIYSSKFKLTFKAAVARITKDLKAQPLSDKFVYLSAVSRYANEVGWEPLIRAGKKSDLKGFIAVGDDCLGEERNIRALRKISDLRGKNVKSARASEGLS